MTIELIGPGQKLLRLARLSRRPRGTAQEPMTGTQMLADRRIAHRQEGGVDTGHLGDGGGSEHCH